MRASSVRIGLDLLNTKWPRKLREARIGLLVHPASVNKRVEHTAAKLQKSSQFRLTALFGPQHGIRGETQDNMVEWEGFRDGKTGLPVFSLYGGTRKPNASVLKDLDGMLIDLQDIGSRYYTFIWTMDLCLEACTEAKKSVIVLDRPNPIGGHLLEGPVLDGRFASFVGRHPLPVRHGMTIGEIAHCLCGEYYPSLDLYVVALQGWGRRMWFDQTGCPWVMPSPNIPTLQTASVYPGMCLLEGTNLSEGRGTTRPFELFGAPFIEPEMLVNCLKKYKLPGVIFRPLYFQPTFQKYAGRLCGGAQIHITERERFRPFKTGVAVIKEIHDLYPGQFSWKQPPYEYEYEKMPIDILAGTDRLRSDIEKGVPLDDMEAWWQEECRDFDNQVRRRYLMYR